MEVGNLKEVTDAIRALKQRFGGKTIVSVAVGYRGCNYALWVHEASGKLKGQPRKGNHPDGTPRKGNYWDPNGIPKFLEKPARELSSNVAQVVTDQLKSGTPLDQALFVGGLLIQRESQLSVPVDTGFLKASAFTEIED